MLYRVSSQQIQPSPGSSGPKELTELLDWGIEDIEWAVDKFKTLDTYLAKYCVSGVVVSCVVAGTMMAILT